ncbi:MAG: aminoacyl-tRNA hydrolase [Synergistaceae bacterium]|nr:aminoacyl-tRNA hydrolase [Synergistaceae bacterium]
MRLIAGLGNPGEQYAFTRHNMGWLCADFIAVNRNLGRPQEKFHGEFWKFEDVIILKPLTFMNASGISVSEAVNFYKIEHSDILIIYDDMALPFGKLRLRAQGSSGGHNGLTSILSSLGDVDVPRLRIGIGKAPGSMINYVLGHFSDNEREKLPEIIGRAGDAVNLWLSRDIQKAMTLVNAETSPAHAVH